MSLGHPVEPIGRFLPGITGENRCVALDAVLQAEEAARRSLLVLDSSFHAGEHLHECKDLH